MQDIKTEDYNMQTHCFTSVKDYAESVINGEESWNEAIQNLDENFERDLLRVLT